MDNKKMTIIDFVEHYTRVFSNHVFLREKINNEWTETTFEQTREMAHRIGAGLMALGMEKGDKVALLSQGRNLWVTGELGILYAGGVNVPLSIKLTEAGDLLFRIQHSDAKYIMASEQQLPKIRKILPECPNVQKVIVFDPLKQYEEREIGIDEVKLFSSYHSERRVANVERFKKIVVAAMKQSVKSKMPLVEEMVSFDKLVKQKYEGQKFIAWIDDDVKEQLCDLYKKGENALVLIGPEGDFSKEEVALAKENGFVPVSLGEARLRTETAAVVACHTIQLINQMK